MSQPIFLNQHVSSLSKSSLENVHAIFKEYQDSLPSFTSSAAQRIFFSISELFNEIGADEGRRFFFFPSVKEALFQLCFSIYSEVVRQTGRNHFLTNSSLETTARDCFKKFEPLGCTSKDLPLNRFGQVTKDILEEALKPRHAFLSLPWANGLTGVIHPIADLAQVCRSNEILFHVDGSLCFGQLFFRLQDLECDFFTVEGFLPRGAGLFTKQGPLFSTKFLNEVVKEDALDLSSFVYALQKHASWTDHRCMETARLKNKLEQGVLRECPDAVVFFQDAERLPHCCALGFPGVESEALAYFLSRRNIHAARGGGRFPLLSEHLLACGVEPSLAKSALSFSLTHETQESEIDRAVEEIAKSVKKLRSFSSRILNEASNVQLQ